MGDTAIGWTHRPGTRGRTWNPVRGCRRKSAGCEHCYAERQAERIVRMGKGKPTPYDGLVKLVNGEPRWTGEIALDTERLAEPLRWRQPSTIFVDSMSDLFYDRRPDEHIAAVFGVAAACPQHTFLILTKYADRMRQWFERAGRLTLDDLRVMAYRAVNGTSDAMRVPRGTHWPLSNVWLGVSVENQDAADERIPELLATPAVVRFLSCEPLLGPVDVRRWLPLTDNERHLLSREAAERTRPRVGWLIDGCESGKEARPALPEWFDSLEAQCRAAGVPYFHKQQMIDGRIAHDFPGRQEFPHV